jgi:ankyrin repeat protein
MYHAKGATPLMLALLFENNECAAALIAEGAKLNLQNSHGLTAADLIRRRSGPEFLLAFEGRVEACRRVSLLSRGWIEMHF